MIHPSIHQEIHRQRQADLIRSAERSRVSSKQPREHSVSLLSRVRSPFFGLAVLTRRKAQPAH